MHLIAGANAFYNQDPSNLVCIMKCLFFGDYLGMSILCKVEEMQSENNIKNTTLKSSPIIVALDYTNKDIALTFVDRINPKDCRLKVGKEMFTLFGPPLVRDLHLRGFDVFLDLKFHDIPYTTAQAVVAAAELGVWMVNIHASGGMRMMTAAKEALLPYGANAPLLIAVTVLTSLEHQDMHDIGIHVSPSDHVERLTYLAYNCGLDGVVCSGHEARRLKVMCGSAFQLVTPGIRPVGSAAYDQRRIMTPVQALAAGVDYIVIGRSITQSNDPAVTLSAIRASLDSRQPNKLLPNK
ncbi:orotidine-5'-phosphate decarboxylase [Serratia symbiotica str. 'Cinara cedri']|nr:orotidine-5'-phosphate decarboxylase [Serratia symbiotica str. 'Cinara cedri']